MKVREAAFGVAVVPVAVTCAHVGAEAVAGVGVALVVLALLGLSLRSAARRRAGQLALVPLFDAAPTLVFLCDDEGRIVYANDAFVAMAGKPRRALIGSRLDEVFSNGEAPALLQAFHDVAGQSATPSAGEARIEVTATNSGPRAFAITSFSRVDANGRLQGAGGMFTPLPRSRDGSAGYDRAETRVRDIVEDLTELVCRFTTEGRLTYVNEPYARWAKQPRNNLVGAPALEPLSASERTLTFEALAQLDDENPTTTRTHSMTEGDVETSWIQWSFGRVRTPAGIEYQGVGRPITSLKQAELALIEARDQALEAAKSRSQFFANMSHEIRTPMNAIIGMTELLQRTDLDGQQGHYVRTIATSAASLLNIINDILDFTKFQSEEVEFYEHDFRLQELIDNVTAMVAEDANRKRLKFVRRIAPNTPAWMRGDSYRIGQVLLNLLNNAIKFTPKGRVELRVQAHMYASQAVRLHVEVQDTGIGIPPERQEAIFHPFSQADGSTTRLYGGTGLGLSICREIVSRLGGSIGVTSSPQKGSCFWFEVPVATPAPPEHGFEPASLDGVRTLIVDDREANRTLLLAHVTSWGSHVEAVSDGVGALARLKSAAHAGLPFRIVILDVLMPGMDGTTLARLIRNDPHVNDVGIVLLTSADSLNVPRDARIDTVLSKPVNAQALHDTLVHLVGDEPSTLRSTAPFAPISSDTQNILRFGSHILVVEDNPANQQVLSAQLHELGCHVSVASGGRRALQMMLDDEYDLILMDVSMPELDGLETTRRIRAQNSRNARLPIVAMTANALPGDQEACLEAGMDDYLAKPVNLTRLQKTLARWLPAISVAFSAHATARLKALESGDGADVLAVLSEVDESTITQLPSEGDSHDSDVSRASTDLLSSGESTERPNISHAVPLEGRSPMNNEAELPSWDDIVRRVQIPEAAVRGIVRTFFTSTDEMLAGIEAACESRSIEECRLHAHSIKGSAASLGFDAVCELARQMENAADAGDLATIAELLPPCKACIDACRSALGETFNT